MNRKKSFLIGALAACCVLSSGVGVTAMAETVSLPAPQSTNVLRGLTAEAFSVKDYSGKAITSFVGQNGQGREYSVGFLNNGDNTSWDAIVPTTGNGTKTLAWFYVDLGQTYTVDKVMMSMNHDWTGTDVVVQLSTDVNFENAVTVYNNDADDSLGCGATFTADERVEVSSYLSNFGAAGQSLDGNGNIFEFTPVAARYMRVTNNQYGNGALWNYTALTELEVYAYSVVETPTTTEEVSPVAFSKAGGLYPNAVTVELSSVHKNAEIYYTLDGSVPTTGSQKYTGAISMTNGIKMLRASAYVNGVMGLPVTAEYVMASVTAGTNVAAGKPVSFYNKEFTQKIGVAGFNGAAANAGLVTDGVVHPTNSCVTPSNDGKTAVLGWAVIDFGGEYLIDKVSANFWHDWGFSETKIQLSTTPDFANPVTVFEGTQYDVQYTLTEYKLDAPVAARYLRAYNNAKAEGKYSVYTELQAYAAGSVETEVNEQIYLASYDTFTTWTVENGTAWENVGLPTELKVTMSNGSTKVLAGICEPIADYTGAAGTYTTKFSVTDKEALLDAYGIYQDIDVTFTVKRIMPIINVEVAERTFCDGNAPTVTVNVSAPNYAVEYYKGAVKLNAAPIEAGVYKVVVSVAEDDRYEGLTVEKTFTLIDKRPLQALIAEANEYTQAAYLAESWAALTVEVTSAAVIANSEDATQTQIDWALAELTAAIDGLQLKGNKTALQNKYNEMKNTQNVYTRASWMLFSEALAEAKGLLESGEVSQAALDMALETLTATYGNLKAKANTSALETAIATAKAVDEDDYVSASRKALEEAIAAAEIVLANDEATQAQADEAKTAIETVMAGLQVKGDKAALTAMLSNVYPPSNYTASTYNAYVIAKEKAEAVIANSDAAQAQVDEAKAALETAVSALKAIGNKTALKNAVMSAEKVVKGEVTEESWAQFQTVLAYAKSVEDSNDVIQADIDEAVALLVKAQSALTTGEDGGCGSVIATAPFALLAMLGAGILLKKKED